LDHLPSVIPLDSAIGVDYPSGYSIASFLWTFTPLDGSAAPAPGTRIMARAGVINFPTASATTAALRSLGLTPGRYTVSVQAVGTSGTKSPAASADVTLVNAGFNAVRVYPNPWRADRHVGKPIIFDGLPLDAQVQIFTVSGHRVATLASVAGQAAWSDLRNAEGDTVASGLYIYSITRPSDSGDKHRGKLALVR
jgi:hypothetical protein